MPKVYNKHHKDAPADAVYVGRGSPYGNPFPIMIPDWGNRGQSRTREQAIAEFDYWINQPDQFELREKIRKNLKGKDLVCYCAPQKCHADTLMRISEDEE